MSNKLTINSLNVQNIEQFTKHEQENKMNNEPVAWMQTWKNQDGELKHTVNIEQIGKNDIPLYTHPAELTDEEIMAIVNDSYMPQGLDKIRYTMFARAILRKAQNK